MQPLWCFFAAGLHIVPAAAQTVIDDSRMPDYMVERLAAALTREMYDPASVQFRRLKRDQERYVCGEFNGRNIYGGYVGFRRFGYDVEGDFVVLAPSKGGDLWETGATSGPMTPQALLNLAGPQQACDLGGR